MRQEASLVLLLVDGTTETITECCAIRQNVLEIKPKVDHNAESIAASIRFGKFELVTELHG